VASIYDVAVVGTGPAGATAARQLARGGAQIVLLDKAELPRYKTCGGGLIGRAMAALPDGALTSPQVPCHRAVMGFPALNRDFTTKRSSAIITMVMRDELDASLTQLAVQAGAELMAARPVTSATNMGDRVRLSTPSGPVDARMVVAADGVHSQVARHSGWHSNPHAVPAVEWEIRVSPADYSRMAGTARFDMTIPGGYAWVFPKNGHLSVGAMTVFRRSIDLHAEVTRYLKQLGLTPIGKVEKHGHLIPIAPRSEQLGHGRTVLVGDAAGLTDPVTGEGISGALHSGALAAQAILAADGNPALAVTKYQTALSTHLLPELAAANRLAALLYQRPGLAGRVFGLVGQVVCEQVTEIMAGRQTYRNFKWDIVPALLGLRRH
jgi:geranylgeranyl reductase family protein